eukprot:Pgem_evm4s2154
MKSSSVQIPNFNETYETTSVNNTVLSDKEIGKINKCDVSRETIQNNKFFDVNEYYKNVLSKNGSVIKEYKKRTINYVIPIVKQHQDLSDEDDDSGSGSDTSQKTGMDLQEQFKLSDYSIPQYPKINFEDEFIKKVIQYNAHCSFCDNPITKHAHGVVKSVIFVEHGNHINIPKKFFIPICKTIHNE